MNKKEVGLSPEAKLEKMFKSWLKPEGIDFISPEAEKGYQVRLRTHRQEIYRPEIRYNGALLLRGKILRPNDRKVH